MKKKSSLPIIIVLSVLAFCCSICIVFFMNFAVIAGNLYSLSSKTLDLKNSGLEDISVLDRFKGLESADISGGTVKSLPPLKKCSSLKTLSVSGSDFPAQDCVEFYENHPDAELTCGVLLGGRRYSSLVRGIQLSGSMNDSEIRMLAALKRVETLDLTGSYVSDDTYDYLKSRMPDCHIIRKVVFDGNEYLNTDESVKISKGFLGSKNAEPELERLKYFESLKEIDAFDCPDSDDLLDLRKRFPQYVVRWNTAMFDLMIDTSLSEIDLSKQEHSLNEFISLFDEKLNRFSNLKKVCMLNCGLSNLEMEKLMERYPDIKFVWYITFSRYKVRTDAVAFSTLIAKHYEAENLNEYTLNRLFKYCTDLVSLDIGHCHCRNISALANMKNLRALIMTGNSVSDISPLAELSKLEFIEMNGNRVLSVAPLGGLKKLKMVNLYNSRSIKDLSPLYNHENLEMVIFDKDVPKAEQQRFIESNPGCTTFFSVDSDRGRTTNAAWRNAELREKYKNSFRKWKNVIGFNEETEEFIYDFDQ